MDLSSELQSILKKQKTAVLVVDMQRDFIDEDGKLSKFGQNISAMQATV